MRRPLPPAPLLPRAPRVEFNEKQKCYGHRAQWEGECGIRAAGDGLGPVHLWEDRFDVITDDVKIKSKKPEAKPVAGGIASMVAGQASFSLNHSSLEAWHSQSWACMCLCVQPAPMCMYRSAHSYTGIVTHVLCVHGSA